MHVDQKRVLGQHAWAERPLAWIIGIVWGSTGLCRDNGKENGNDCLGFGV